MSEEEQVRSTDVVVAVDGSPASNNAVRWAANTAAKRNVALRLASSYTMPQFLYAEGMVPPQELYDDPVSYTHLTLPTIRHRCRSRWSPYH